MDRWTDAASDLAGARLDAPGSLGDRQGLRAGEALALIAALARDLPDLEKTMQPDLAELEGHMRAAEGLFGQALAGEELSGEAGGQMRSIDDFIRAMRQTRDGMWDRLQQRN